METLTAGQRENERNSPCKLWQCGDPEEYINLLPKNDGDPLDNLYNRMNQYDKSKCDAWRDEVEKLLIFAGLFSATVTAFTGISYQWLQEDQAATSAQLLERISLQLGAISNNTVPSLASIVSQPFTADHTSVRINILWFASLILCLSTVIFGILCLQWIRQFTREISMPVKVAIPIRQMRYDGLRYWKVPEIISALSVVLQISVLLFFAGILEFLWTLNREVAACCTVFVGLIAVGLAFTTFSPLIQTIQACYVPPSKQCPYKSPLSWILLRFGILVNQFMQSFFRSWHSRFLNGHKISSWTDLDVTWHRISRRANDAFRVKDNYDIGGFVAAFEWTVAKLSPNINHDVTRDLFHALHSSLPRNVAKAVLQLWAGSSGSKDNEVAAALSLKTYDSRSAQAGYDLLMAWMLRRCSLTDNCRDLINELRIRYLNTIDNDASTEEVFSRLVQNHRFLVFAWNSNEDELDSQALLALMNYHKTKCFRQKAFDIGGTLGLHIKRVQVREDNVSRCYALLIRFKSIIDEICQSTIRWRPPKRSPTDQSFVTTSTPQRSSTISSMLGLGKGTRPSRPFTLTASDCDQWHPRNVAKFLRFFNLCALRRWENDIENIAGELEAIRVADVLASFLKNTLLPALAEDEAFGFISDDIRRNLEQYCPDKPADHL
ncbi:hypothetical protein JOM56_000167 [Amanita muscaria]